MRHRAFAAACRYLQRLNPNWSLTPTYAVMLSSAAYQTLFKHSTWHAWHAQAAIICAVKGCVEHLPHSTPAARRVAAEAEARASASADELARVRSAAESGLAAQRAAAKDALAEATATARAHAEEQLQAALGQVGASVTAGTGMLKKSREGNSATALHAPARLRKPS